MSSGVDDFEAEIACERGTKRRKYGGADDADDGRTKALADQEVRMAMAGLTGGGGGGYDSDGSSSSSRSSSSSSRSMVVRADVTDSMFGGLPQRPFHATTSFSAPDVFSGTSSGVFPSGAAGRLQSALGGDFGRMSRGSNMNKTDESWPVVFTCAVSSDFDDYMPDPEGMRTSGLTSMDFGKTYREWQIAKSNLCFRSYSGRNFAGNASEPAGYTGHWVDNTVRCLAWFYLNFELRQRRNHIYSKADFSDAYGYLGYLQTVGDGHDTLGSAVGSSAGSSWATFHASGSSRMPNIWAPQEDGAGLKTNACLWLILRFHCEETKGKDGTSVVKFCGLRIEPWADAVSLTTADRVPAGTLHMWYIGHLKDTEGSSCPPREKLDRAFYPTVDTGNAAHESLTTILNMLPKCNVNVGVGSSMFVSA